MIISIKFMLYKFSLHDGKKDQVIKIDDGTDANDQHRCIIEQDKVFNKDWDWI
jgi:hypothetical protein